MTGAKAATERKIYRLVVACGALVAAAFVLPRFAANPEGGFASGATAVLVFLGMLALAFLVSVYLVAATLREHRNLSTPAKISGIAPAVILGISLLGLIVFLAY